MLEDIIKTKDNWMELEESLPPNAIKDVGKFVANLYQYWELAGASMNLFRKENANLRNQLTICKDYIGIEKANMLDRGRINSLGKDERAAPTNQGQDR